MFSSLYFIGELLTFHKSQLVVRARFFLFLHGKVKSERKIIKLYAWPQKSICFFLRSAFRIKIMHKIALKHLFGASYFRAHCSVQEISTFSSKINLRNLSHKRTCFFHFWRARLFNSNVACDLAVVGKLNMKKSLLARIFFKLSNKKKTRKGSERGKENYSYMENDQRRGPESEL